ncbi:hypothetical protein THASP1DRAFT_31255 [Thamnocephalis sphaerospora]|uniref:Uncharacterized protein n=1 Tax=Thamnocephalis sphaerospora TaxID=78915 RepID=A0A4P9XM64_9FUNG|nr:hypothetical protein THASP1DRAFT_31255 [Thamnocephalis sphaerospora]|eukprot:RKP06932.1 hypothetical protein THASP1DRAFT_31255 [Thamnocephalis sphaerospora]
MDDTEEVYYWAGIKMHRSGDRNGFEFLVSDLDDPVETRIRFYGIALQLCMNSMIFAIFVRNFYRTMRMLIRSPHNLPSWCCAVQAGAGVIFGIIGLAFALPTTSSCRAAVWFSNISLPISNICVSVVLLQKAWLAHKKDNRLLLIGALLILPQPVTTYIVWALSPTMVVPHAGCVFHYPNYYPWLKFGIDMPINLVLSVAFLVVVIRQHRVFGSDTWAYLSRDGMIYMFCVILSNFACALIAAAKLANDFSDMFFLVDWVITSTLLIRQHEGVRVALQQSTRPKTNFQRFDFGKSVGGGIDAIATAPDIVVTPEDPSQSGYSKMPR